MARLPLFHLDLSAFPERDQFEIFREVTAVTHEVSKPNDAGRGFSAAADVWNLGSIVVNRSKFEACRFERSARRASTDGIDHYTLLYMMKGSCGGGLGSSEVSVDEGQVFLLDLGRPISFQVTATENVFISIPRELLDAVVPPGNLHGRVLEGPSGALLCGFIRLLTEHIGKLNSQEATLTERATRDLVAACLLPSQERNEKARPAIDSTLLQRARRYIEVNLKSEHLTTAGICRAVGVSRSTLYRLFEPMGGVAAYVQGRRLAQVRKALIDPLEKQRIAEIASRWGFVNAEHFSRAFRRAYGRSPSEFRNDARFGPLEDKPSQHEYHSWLRGEMAGVR